MQVLRPMQTNRIFRFGEVEFSGRSGELRQNGAPVLLTDWPLAVAPDGSQVLWRKSTTNLATRCWSLISARQSTAALSPLTTPRFATCCQALEGSS